MMEREEINRLVNDLPSCEKEVELMRELSELGEEERFDVLTASICGDDLAQLLSILRLIKRSITSHDKLLAVLDIGIRNGKPQEIGYWLNTLLPEIGAKEVLAACSKYVDEDADLVVAIWDHLATMIGAIYPELEDDLVALSSKIDCVKYGFCAPPSEWSQIPPDQ